MRNLFKFDQCHRYTICCIPNHGAFNPVLEWDTVYEEVAW